MKVMVPALCVLECDIDDDAVMGLDPESPFLVEHFLSECVQPEDDVDHIQIISLGVFDKDTVRGYLDDALFAVLQAAGDSPEAWSCDPGLDESDDDREYTTE